METIEPMVGDTFLQRYGHQHIDVGGKLRNSRMDAHISTNCLIGHCRQSRSTRAGRTTGPRPNARTKLADNLHKAGVQQKHHPFGHVAWQHAADKGELRNGMADTYCLFHMSACQVEERYIASNVRKCPSRPIDSCFP